MTLAACVARVGTWTVPGITTNYGLDDLPGVLPEVALPALVLQAVSDGRDEPFDLGVTNGVFTVQITHAIVGAGVGMGNTKTALYNLIALIDAYLVYMKSDWTLNDNLLQPMRIVHAVIKPMVFGSVAYWGCAFTLEWVLVV